MLAKNVGRSPRIKTGQENSGLRIAVPRLEPLETVQTEVNTAAETAASIVFAIFTIVDVEIYCDMVTKISELNFENDFFQFYLNI